MPPAATTTTGDPVVNIPGLPPKPPTPTVPADLNLDDLSLNAAYAVRALSGPPAGHDKGGDKTMTSNKGESSSSVSDSFGFGANGGLGFSK